MDLQGGLLDGAEDVVEGGGASLPPRPITRKGLGGGNGPRKRGGGDIGSIIALTVDFVETQGGGLGGGKVCLNPLDRPLPKQEPPQTPIATL